MSKNTKLAALITSGTLLAGVAGYGASVALSSSAQAPTVTTTINIPTGGATGPAGPAGPAGPPGPAGSPGAEGCPSGSRFEAVEVNHSGGKLTIWTCVAGA